MNTESAVSSFTPPPGAPPSLVFTDAAAAKVSELIREESNPNLKLRVFVQGGGCSGFQYGFTFDENLEEGDTSVENAGVTLLIDPMSIQYLAGAETHALAQTVLNDELPVRMTGHDHVKTVGT